MPSSIGRALAFIVIFASFTAAADEKAGFAETVVARGITLLQGYECNITASSGGDGVVLVDTCGVQVADQLREAVERLSEKPVRFVINTHAHADHTGGDAAFQKRAPVIAHNNARKRMASGNEVTGDKPSPPEALPMVTFEGEMTLHLNGEDIRLLSLPPGHTDDDVVVIFTNGSGTSMERLHPRPRATNDE